MISEFLDNDLVSLSEHCSRLSHFLACDAASVGFIQEKTPYNYSLDDSDFWEQVFSPLRIASCIESININSNVFSDSSYMCSQAYDFEKMQSKLYAEYVREITIFTWIRIALENIIDLIGNKNIGNRENRLISVLNKSNFSWKLKYLKNLTGMGFDLAPEEIKNRALKSISLKKEENFSHIHLCREARNELFHSHNILIEPQDWGEDTDYLPEKDEYVLFIHILSRLTLLDIQSILFIYLKDINHVTWRIIPHKGIAARRQVAEAVRVLHLATDYNYDLDLDFDLDDPEDKSLFLKQWLI